MGIIMASPTTQQLKILDQPALQPLQEIYDDMILAEGLTVFPVAIERYYAKLGMTRAQFDIIKQLLQLWGEIGKAPWFGPNDLEENFDKSKRQMQRDLRNLSKDGFIIIHEVDGSDGLHYTLYDCTPFLEMISQLVKLHQHLGTKQKKKPTNLSGLSPFKRGPQMSANPVPQPETQMSSGTKMSADLSSQTGTKVSSRTKMSADLNSQAGTKVSSGAKASTNASSQASTDLSCLTPTKPVTHVSNDKNDKNDKNVPFTRTYIRALDFAKVSNSKLDNYINIINILFSNSNYSQVPENIAQTTMTNMSLSSTDTIHPMTDMSNSPTRLKRPVTKMSNPTNPVTDMSGGNEHSLPIMSAVALQEVSQAFHDHYPKTSKHYAERIYGNFIGINRIQDDLSMKNPDASFANLINYVHQKLKNVDMKALKASQARHGMSLFFTELHACAFEQYQQIKQLREQRNTPLRRSQTLRQTQPTPEKIMPPIHTAPPMTDVSMSPHAQRARVVTARGAYMTEKIATESVAESLLALAQHHEIFIADEEIEALRTNTASEQLIEKIKATLLEHINSEPYPA